jgi:xanthine dehydrogenase accessory factor
MKTWSTILKSVEKHGTAVMVAVTRVEGSSPREEGACMIVTPEGFYGTIGGGTLEWKAMAMAQKALGRPAGTSSTQYSLGPDLGQCCGGRVALLTETFDASSLPRLAELAERESKGAFDHRRKLYLFGAGHVGRALIMALAPLPFDVQWIDPRPNAFPRFVPENVTLLSPEMPERVLGDAPEGSLVFVMSHSHALDLSITDAALRNSNIAHAGLIGSATKRTRFEKRLREAGVDESRIRGLICPIGIGGIASKEPAAIAVATAAQCLVLHEALLAAASPARPRMAEGGA